MKISSTLALVFISFLGFSQNLQKICLVSEEDQSPVVGAIISAEGMDPQLTDSYGCAEFETSMKEAKLNISALGFEKITLYVTQFHQTIELNPLILQSVIIQAEKEGFENLQRMGSIENYAIYASKKTEVVSPESRISNYSQNQARQTFSNFSGLNIWDDASGLQLSIGARGLDPNRSSNFAIRQGGFDISADPLGYPESYYTPPMQAVERIELVRGTGALQYGSQFGGLLNFKMKEGPQDKKLEYRGELGMASFNTFHSFQSIGGQVGKLNYYLSHSYRESEGWRPNSGFESNSIFGGFKIDFNTKSSLKIELSRMHYLAQQPGGLTNSEFLNTPSISNRSRNWFDVKWQTAGIDFQHHFNERTKIKFIGFGLLASRKALGFLGAPSRIDPGDERELISGIFENYGLELKLEHRYLIGNKYAVLVSGIKQFRGNTANSQGVANDDDGPSFDYLAAEFLSGSDFIFNTDNQAFFIEQLIYVSERFSINPGFRLERIATGSEGYFTTTLRDGAGNILPGYPAITREEKTNTRLIPLFGFGLQYASGKSHEIYLNITQNYRAVNFSDLYVNIPGLLVDEDLRDESGFSGDLGWRFKYQNKLSLEATIFWLEYQDRIGVIYQRINDPILGSQAVQFRSNLADARSLGVELNTKITLLNKPLKGNSNFKWFMDVGASYIEAKYINGPSSVDGNLIENVPQYTARIGQQINWRNWTAQASINWTGLQYSDAGNAAFSADINAVAGEIPAYYICDLALGYTRKHWSLSAGMNNAFNQNYFTRRATGYPGPGIIPSDPRSYFLKLSWQF